jgi:hypothetical protein
VLAGAGLGALGGAVLGQTRPADFNDAGNLALDSAALGAVGAGLGLVASRDDAWWVGLMDAGTVGGATYLALRPRAAFPETSGVGFLAGLYGLYQGAGVSLLLESSDRQVGGAMLMAGTLGWLGGRYFVPALHLDTTDVLMLLSGSAWGVWIGAWTAAALAEDPGHPPPRGGLALGVGTTALATDVALALTGFAISELVRLPPVRFAWISVAGGGGLLGGLVVSALSNDHVSARKGVLFGTLTGLAAGTVGTAFGDFAPRAPADVAAQDVPAVPLPLGIDRWMPHFELAPDPQRPELPPRLVLGVQGTLR